MALVVRMLWGPRETGVDDAVEHISTTLETLAEFDPDHYGTWFRPGQAKGSARHYELVLSNPDIRGELRQHREDLDAEGQPIASLGWTFHVTNGAAGKDAIEFGCTFGVTSERIANFVIFGLPSGTDVDSAGVDTLIGRLAKMWQPERVVITDLGGEVVRRVS